MYCIKITALSLWFSSCLMASQVLAHQYSHAQLNIVKPHITLPPPGSSVAAGYLVIENRGASNEVLLSVDSNISIKTEIHQVTVENDIARMRQISQGIEITEDQIISFEPGKNHIMFIGLKKDLIEGESHTVTLNFKQSGKVSLPFKVWESNSSGNKTKGRKSHHH